MPRFSVVVPAYNAHATLSETLDAMAAQLFEDWECVVVDDGSTDDTAEITQRYVDRDPRFRLISQQNTGTAGAYRTGVAAAQSDLLSICASDDLLLPEHLLVMDEFVRANPDYDIYSCNGQYLYHETGSTRTVYWRPEWQKERSLTFDQVVDQCFYSVGAVFRRAIYDAAGGHRLGVYVDDYDFWLRAMARGARHLYTPRVLSVHRVSGFQQSANIERLFASDAEVYANLLASEDLSPEMRAAVETKLAQQRNVAEEEALELQSRAFRSKVERVVGPRFVEPTLRVIHLFSWVTIPLRRARARRRAAVQPANATGSQGTATPQKVLVIPSWYPSAAHPTAGVFIAAQVAALAESLEVAVLHVGTDEGAFAPSLSVEEGVTVVRAGIAATGLRDRYFGYRRAGEDAYQTLSASWGSPDIIHVQALWPAALIARAISKRDGIRYVVTEHSEEYLPGSQRRLVRHPSFVRFILRPLALGAARTIAVSRFLADRLESLGLAVRPVVIPNIVPVSTPAPSAAGSPHVIAHVSVMGPAKDLPGLLAAIDLLRSRRTDFVLKLVGDGECRVATQDLAATFELEGFVEFVGRKSAPEVLDILAGAAFTVVSSTHETFSVSAAESLMAGRPVLSTRCGGPEEFVTPEVGMLVEAGDPQALADGLDRMLDGYGDFDPDALHAYAAARFAPAVVAQRILGVYEEVLNA